MTYLYCLSTLPWLRNRNDQHGIFCTELEHSVITFWTCWDIFSFSVTEQLYIWHQKSSEIPFCYLVRMSHISTLLISQKSGDIIRCLWRHLRCNQCLKIEFTLIGIYHSKLLINICSKRQLKHFLGGNISVWNSLQNIYRQVSFIGNLQIAQKHSLSRREHWNVNLILHPWGHSETVFHVIKSPDCHKWCSFSDCEHICRTHFIEVVKTVVLEIMKK